MLEILQGGGWLMLPILIASIAALGIVFERLWVLRRRRIVPPKLTGQVWRDYSNGRMDAHELKKLANGSPLGKLLACLVQHLRIDASLRQQQVEEQARHLAAELERHVSWLGTIAEITPLLGLLGTVVGMIEVFFVITDAGVGDPTILAGGISQALLTTAAGLTVAIPTMVAYRYLRRHIDGLLIALEKELQRFAAVADGLEVSPG